MTTVGRFWRSGVCFTFAKERRVDDDPRIRVFRLKPTEQRTGISCDETGVFVDGVPLLVRHRDIDGQQVWEPLSLPKLNAIMTRLYGLPLDMSVKIGGLSAIANALNKRNISLAMIATLHLR